MSNNDLYCYKCKSHHHPVDCPLDVSKEKDWLVELIKKHGERVTGYTILQRPMKDLAHSIRQELVRRIEGKKESAEGTQREAIVYFIDGRNTVIDEIINEIGGGE